MSDVTNLQHRVYDVAVAATECNRTQAHCAREAVIKCPAWRHHYVGSVVRRSVSIGHLYSSPGDLHMTFCSLANSLLAVTVPTGLWNFRFLVLSLAAHWYFCSLAGTFALGMNVPRNFRVLCFVSCNFRFTSCHISCHAIPVLLKVPPTHRPTGRATGKPDR